MVIQDLLMYKQERRQKERVLVGDLSLKRNCVALKKYKMVKIFVLRRNGKVQVQELKNVIYRHCFLNGLIKKRLSSLKVLRFTGRQIAIFVQNLLILLML